MVARDGVPSVWLEAGRHVATGAYAYSALPEGIVVPPDTALLSLRVAGAAVEFFSHQNWVEVPGLTFAVDEDRRSPAVPDGVDAGGESKAAHQHLVAEADSNQL